MKVKLGIGLTLVLMALMVVIGQAQGPDEPDQQGPEWPGGGEMQPLGALAATETVSSTFSYQGVLKESGQPVTGDREMVFRLYSNDVCTSLVGSPITYTVLISNGLFSVNLAVDQADFDGQALWLETEVGGTSVGCQEILPVPYALSLRPGAIISGSVAYGTVYGNAAVAILNDAGRGLYVERLGSGSGSAGYFVNNGTTDGVYAQSEQGDGVSGQSDGTAFAAGVRGLANAITGTTYGGYFRSNSDEGIGVYANANNSSGTTYGVWGQSNSTTGAGVYARGTDDGADLVLGGNANTGLGDDGKIYSDPAYAGSDIFLHSYDAVLIDLDEDDDESGDLIVRSGADDNVFRVSESGDVFQLSTGGGLVKAAAYVNCRSSGSGVHRFFNNVGSAITVSNGAGAGQCIVDFGFEIHNRFWVATGVYPAPSRGVSCAREPFDPTDQLRCSQWSGDTGLGVDGDIMVLIY